MRGYIRKYNTERGYGFIDVGESGELLFFHISGLPNRKAPEIGQKVEFKTTTTPKGQQAIDIQYITEYGEATYTPFENALK